MPCVTSTRRSTVVKVSEGKNTPPSINQVGPDPDILKLGLPNTLRVGLGNVPNMFLLLQGGHYDLVVARQSIGDKLSQIEKDKGYEGEEEEEQTKDNPKTMEEQLKDMEDKYIRLQQSYTRSLEEIKCLKAKLETKSNNPSDNDSDDTGPDEANHIVISKGKGYRKTTPPSESEENLKCPVCK